MKKILAVLSFTFSFSAAVVAHPAEAPLHGEIQAQATEQTRALANFIGINEYEYIQVKKLNESRLLEIQDAVKEYEDKEILALNIRDINRKFEKSVLNLLDVRQKKAYFQYKHTNNQTIFTASL
ncbi:MAG: hypothetical protein ACO1O1_14300 [Adhaeribacter sp.]